MLAGMNALVRTMTSEESTIEELEQGGVAVEIHRRLPGRKLQGLIKPRGEA